MGVVEAIRTKLDPVQRLEAELAKLNAAGAATCSEVEDLEARENAIEDADELMAGMAKARAAKNRLARIDRDIAVTRERLALARDEERAKLQERLVANYLRAADGFLKQAGAAWEAVQRTLAAHQALYDAGFHGAYQAAPTLPRMGYAVMLDPESLVPFKRMLAGDSHPWGPATVIKPSPIRRTPAAPPVLGRIDGQRAVRLDERSAPPPPKRAVHADSAIDGEVLVIVLRDGVEHPTKGALIVGDVVSFPRDQAIEMVRNGAIDFAPVPEPEALSGKDEQVAPINAGNGTAQPQPEEETK